MKRRSRPPTRQTLYQAAHLVLEHAWDKADVRKAYRLTTQELNFALLEFEPYIQRGIIPKGLQRVRMRTVHGHVIVSFEVRIPLVYVDKKKRVITRGFLARLRELREELRRKGMSIITWQVGPFRPESMIHGPSVPRKFWKRLTDFKERLRFHE